MPAPELILIKRMEDLQTALMGRCEIGQVFVPGDPSYCR